MYDELVKRLKNCATQAAPCKTCDMTEDGSCSDTFMKQAANAIGELSKPRWIPVTERLPEVYVNVLCHLRSLDRQSEYYSIDHLMEDGQWWKAANSWKHEVTHWMPLPAPPEEDGDVV